MTLILSYVCDRFAIQVSDRLLTATRGRVRSTFDRDSNKTVVYVCPNGVVSISYAGAAYIDGIPTDAWIATVLMSDSTGVISSDGSPYPECKQRWTTRDLKQSLWLLWRELPRAFRRMPIARRTDPVVIVVAGWRISRRHELPFAACVTGNDPEGHFSFESSPRYGMYVGRRNDLNGFLDTSVRSAPPEPMISSVPDPNLSQRELQELDARVRGRPPEFVEQAMAETIRKVADVVPEVGRDLMSVVIPPPRSGQLRIRYLPYNPTGDARVNVARAGSDVNMYSPWVVSPGLRAAPTNGRSYGSQIVTGSPFRGREKNESFSVLIEGPAPTDDGTGLRIWLRGQRRPPDPTS